MSRRLKFPAVLAGVLVASLAASLVAVAGGPSGGEATASKRGGFSPGKIAGKWTGSWRNVTFGSKGSIRANLKPRPGNRLVVLVDFGGFVFGCSDPPAAPVTLRRGKGKNRWNAKGFRVATQTDAFGKLNVVYDFRRKSFKGRGAAPPCNPEITYTIAGRLTPKRFRATVKIDLGSQTAVSKLSATKR